MSQGEDNKLMDEAGIETIVDKTIRKTNIIMDSQILTGLMECPRRSDFRFNLRLQSLRGKSNSLECGSILHKFMEVYFKSIINGLDRDKSFAFGMTAAELYVRGCPDCTGFTPTPEVPKPVCGHKVDDYPGVQNTPADSEGYKTGWKFVLETCEKYHKHYRNDHWVPLEVEVVKSKVLYEDDDIRILWKAKLDLIADTSQGIFPVDHKTMKQKRKATRLNNQFMGQCMMMGTRNVIINKIGFQKTLPDAEKFERAVISYSADALTEWYSETLPYYAYKLLEFAEAGYYPPNYSNCEGKYGPCPFLSVCEANPSMREDELRMNFVVGPEWNPTNDEEVGD